MKILRLLIIFLVLTLLSYLIILSVYDNLLNYENASNAMFVVGTVVFLPSLIMHTGSFEVFDGFKYAMQSFFVKEFRKRYRTFSEYKEDIGSIMKTSFFMELMIASFIIVIIAIYIAYGIVL